MCYNVLQCGVVCCSVLQRVAACYKFWARLYCVWSAWCAIACCSVVTCGAVCGRVLRRVAACCSVLQCIAVCCSVLPISSASIEPRNVVQQCVWICIHSDSICGCCNVAATRASECGATVYTNGVYNLYKAAPHFVNTCN